MPGSEKDFLNGVISGNSIPEGKAADPFVEAIKQMKSEVEEPMIPHVDYGKDEGVNIKAFNPDDDVLADKSREELIEELGKTGVTVEEGEEIHMTDEITGETVISDIDEENNDIDSLQDLNVEDTISQMTELSRQHIQVLAPPNYTEEQIDELCKSLEEKLMNTNKYDIEKFTSETMRMFVGDDIFNHIKKLNPHPLAALKGFLISIRDSFVEKKNIINAMAEMDIAMKFFNNKSSEDIQKEIYAELDKDPDKYPTELHKYKGYLNKYIDYLHQSNIEDNTFIQGEIDTANAKLAALDDALNFTTIKTRSELLKNDIMRSFADVKKIDKVILGFIGLMHEDESMMIQFPVPKNFVPKEDPNAVIKLTSMWTIFLELLIMYKDFPKLQDLSHADYYRLTELVSGMKGETPDEEQDAILEAIIAEYDITPKVIMNAKNCAILITFTLAKIFNPKKLDTHRKYVLSYTMAIISNSMNKSYLKLAHEIIDIIIYNFVDKKEESTEVVAEQ